jgi:peptidoglycan/xylan/chitin deacetylase (PgdA/CDA1 family)
MMSEEAMSSASTPSAGQRIPILCFHHLADIDYYTSIRPKTFIDLVAHLGDRFRFYTCAEVRRHLQEGVSFTAKPVVLTFDDGYADNFEPLRAAADAIGLRATIFPVADYVGRTNDWNRRAPYRALHMTARELRTLASCGFEIGCHTLDHVNLARHDSHELIRQLVDCKRMLEDLLGTDVETIAYPYGTYTPEVLEVVRKHYRTGFTTSSKKGGDDWMDTPFTLRRYCISESTSIADVDEAIKTWEAP